MDGFTQATRGYQGKTEPLVMMSAMKATDQTNTFFVILMALGLWTGYFVQKDKKSIIVAHSEKMNRAATTALLFLYS